MEPFIVSLVGALAALRPVRLPLRVTISGNKGIGIKYEIDYYRGIISSLGRSHGFEFSASGTYGICRLFPSSPVLFSRAS